jgi:plasmid stabilization system protein ParE
MGRPKKVLRHPLADAEAEEAVDHYEADSGDAARRFLIELRETTRRIQRDPRLYPLTIADARRSLLRDFPYSVIYRETPREIQILAIAHGKRRPGYWRKRTF